MPAARFRSWCPNWVFFVQVYFAAEVVFFFLNCTFRTQVFFWIMRSVLTTVRGHWKTGQSAFVESRV